MKTAAGTVPGKEHHAVKFRCFDVAQGLENAQIYGEILGSKIGHICLSFDRCDYQSLCFFLKLTISITSFYFFGVKFDNFDCQFLYFWLSLTFSTISFFDFG